MNNNFAEINVRGKRTRVPALPLGDKMVVVLGKWVRIASVHDEEWMKGQVVADPSALVTQIKTSSLKADVFTFAQQLPRTAPAYPYSMDWDNAAAIPVTTYSDWWEKRLPQVTRKNVRRSAKRGVVVRTAPFSDDLVKQIADLNQETQVKQGMPFQHHGKDLATIKEDLSSFLDRCDFICAYHGEELIGFIKLVYLGEIASILHIVSKDSHYDKRPANALVAKAVELSAERKLLYLLYGKYTYGNKTKSPLREFKYRNGFEEIRFPRYHVPLTLKGRIFIGLRLHRGLIGWLPAGLIEFLLRLRSGIHRTARMLVGSTERSAPTGDQTEPEPENA